MPTRKENLSRGDIIIQYVLILLVCFFAFFINNEMIPADLMESRNLATAQEMVRTGEYLIPTMNGELRLEKPPLPTWISAGIEHVFPGSLIAHRCASGVIATVMVFFLYFLAARLTRNRYIGFISSLVLATCFNVVLMGRTATWDIYCHSFMLGAIYFMVVGFEKEGAQWKHFILSGIFMGLSFLSKGPVSFYALLLPFLVSFLITYRPNVRGKIGPIITMILLCVILSTWWTVFMYIFHQDMLVSVYQKESSSWIEQNVRPWYYYWKFPAEAGVWALFLITSIIYFFLSKRRENRREFRFFIFWFIASLIFLSIIPEKKSRYLLPVLIPGSGVIAFYIYQCFKGLRKSREKLVFRLNAMLITLILAAIPFAMYFIFYKEGIISLITLLISVVLSWGLCIYILKCLFNKNGVQVLGTFGGIIACMVMIEAFCLIPIGHMFINEDRHSIRMLRENEAVQRLPFFYNEDEVLRMELVYESNKTIRPMDIADTTFVYKNIPFVFVSGEPISDIFDDMNVTIVPVDTYDNNWQKRTRRRYNMDLVREVAVIKPK